MTIQKLAVSLQRETIKTLKHMKNITFKSQNKFGSTTFQKIDGRKFSGFIRRIARENCACEYDIIKHYVEKLVSEERNKHIIHFEFSWYDEFNHKHSIVK